MKDIMARYLTKYGKPRFFTFHWFAKEFVGASLQLCNAWIATDLFNSSLRFFYIPFYTHSRNIYNQLFVNYIHLILMPKVDI
jgi:hypothetical protein